MHFPRIGFSWRIPLFFAMVILVIPAISSAEDYKVFTSEEYGFTMKYPASWVKLDRPIGNYYVVFQAPDLTDGFRDRIQIAAHKPSKDPLSSLLAGTTQRYQRLTKENTDKGQTGSPDYRRGKVQV